MLFLWFGFSCSVFTARKFAPLYQQKKNGHPQGFWKFMDKINLGFSYFGANWGSERVFLGGKVWDNIINPVAGPKKNSHIFYYPWYFYHNTSHSPKIVQVFSMIYIQVFWDPHSFRHNQFPRHLRYYFSFQSSFWSHAPPFNPSSPTFIIWQHPNPHSHHHLTAVSIKKNPVQIMSP